MKVNERILNIIEDHESITQTLDQIVSALENNTPMPNFIPVLHDTLITDHLSKICEVLNARKHE
ncbi:hypothetical protein [Prevotella sp. E2-28]|uniref:hypothetical protein n=1 Tax=Prevotella sp. E2-28 TaxID=2913620 RepID=UPI001EDAFC3A|nr:hypothetical protein [Prevotella sp. E2-28]UKK52681.1 hypothetical protein L6465_08695 [Prevotella sp. E2-28]